MNVLDITIHVGLSQPKNGAQERYANLARQLTARDNSVIVLEAAEFVDPQDAKLATIYSYNDPKFVGRTLRVFRDLAPSFVRSVIRILRENAVDLIQISHPSGAFAVKLVTLLTASSAPLVYAPHNVESELVRETFSNDLQYTRIERFVLPLYIFVLELLICRFVAQHVITVSERDRDIIIRRFRLAPAKISVIPSGCSLDRLPTGEEKARARREQGISEHASVIVFHGFYPFPPNREAFDVIEQYLAPRLRTVNSNILFLVGGTGAPAFQRENVRSVGFIEDLPRFLAAGDIAIVPIGAGSGTRLKIFQYMNRGLPIVTTEKGIEGVSAQNGEHALIVPSVDERFVDKVVCLLDTESERARLGANARKLLEARYTWDAIGAQLLGVYKRVLEGRHGA
ncbi:MAG: glycosyltransferase family 4 protein [Halobacteriota archaeon]